MSHLSRRFALQVTAAAAISAVPLSRALSQTAPPMQDALSMMTSDARFSDWVQLLEYTGLAQYAAGDQPFTAFIPTNKAFSKYPQVLAEVLRPRTRAFPDTTLQVQFVRSHVVLDIHPLTQVEGAPVALTSIAGNSIVIRPQQAGVYDVRWTSINSMLASAIISGSPIRASNAIIYPYDDVTLISA
jgi:uncharacterized surface protein with fasciclin (FAS1) repeats